MAGELIKSGRRLHRTARALLAEDTAARDAVAAALRPLTDDLVRTELARMPVTQLKKVSEGRLRITPLEQAGHSTVLDVLDAPDYQLRTIPGLGAQSVMQLQAAAQQLANAVRDSVSVRLDVDDRNPRATALVVALSRLAAPGPDLPRAVSAARRLDTALDPLLTAAGPARSRWRMMLAGHAKRTEALDAVHRLGVLLAEEASAQTELLLTQVTTDLLRTHTGAEAWIDFELSAAEYYSLLAEIATRPPSPEAARGFVPDDLAARVNAQPLDDTHRRVALRGYQEFGARFALTQRRVILGDEMGLGKAIEAIAVLAHLRAEGHTHFLVACPASVLVNWLREIETRSTLAGHRLHGASREDAAATWLHTGGVAVTTIDSLHRLEIPAEIPVAAVVIDEAHYIKNPQTRRAKAAATWCDRAPYALFLTGTPMENQISEFHNLVDYLQPGLWDRQRRRFGAEANRAEGFRRAVAPVYLRRNQQDVLTELPDLVAVDEWTMLSAADERNYEAAVAAGDFMGMRRAAYAAGPESAKLQRLLEIVEDAAEHDLKVVVFSYFHDVLATVAAALGAVHGPITGQVPPARRQQLIDEFSAEPGHAVLLSQIGAGGTGLNIQAASVVILCEPQLKPSLEAQAVARAHRMGQVRTVRAHRLLTADSIDQRLLRILRRKSTIFDRYLRRSSLAESAPEAVDITQADLARQIVEEEQLRLAS